jgi:hypothetical protein
MHFHLMQRLPQLSLTRYVYFQKIVNFGHCSVASPHQIMKVTSLQFYLGFIRVNTIVKRRELYRIHNMVSNCNRIHQDMNVFFFIEIYIRFLGFRIYKINEDFFK